MCLAVPGKLVKKEEKTGIVDFFGVKRKVYLTLLEEVEEGDYVLVHVGFAIQIIDPKTARQEYHLLAKLAGEKNG